MTLDSRRSGGSRGRYLTILLRDWLRRRHGLLIIAIMLTGCAVGPVFQVPEPPPVTSYLPKDRPSGTPRERVPGPALVRGGDIPARWWELFHSRYLNQLIEQGILHNTDLRAAEDAVRVAQANALAQRGALFPTAVGNFNASRQKTAGDLTSPLASGASTFSLFTTQVTVNYVADV